MSLRSYTQQLDLCVHEKTRGYRWGGGEGVMAVW